MDIYIFLQGVINVFYSELAKLIINKILTSHYQTEVLRDGMNMLECWDSITITIRYHYCCLKSYYQTGK